jgi:hypothetical protein
LSCGLSVSSGSIVLKKSKISRQQNSSEVSSSPGEPAQDDEVAKQRTLQRPLESWPSEVRPFSKRRF